MQHEATLTRDAVSARHCALRSQRGANRSANGRLILGAAVALHLRIPVTGCYLLKLRPRQLNEEKSEATKMHFTKSLNR